MSYIVAESTNHGLIVFLCLHVVLENVLKVASGEVNHASLTLVPTPHQLVEVVLQVFGLFDLELEDLFGPLPGNF